MIAALVPFVAAAALAGASPRPLTLREATEIALRSDPGVARANVDVERARLQTLLANLERVHVSVDASVQELYAGASTPFFADTFAWKSGVLGLANVQGSVDVPIFSGFRVESDIARAEKLENAATFDVDRARRDVALAVARAYWSERRLALLQDAQKTSEARLEESERIVIARVNAGLAAGLDKNRAASRRAQLDVERASLASERRAAGVQLASVLGIDEPVVLVDDPPAPTAAPGDADVDALVQEALDARPELKAAELRGAAVDEEKRAAQSGFWPQLGAGVLMQVGNNPVVAGAGNRAVAGAAVPFFGSSGDVQAGVTLSMNLFDTWATTHAVEDAAHRRRLADEELRALRRDVEGGVRVAYAKLVSLREQRAAIARARAIDADDVVILQHAYERGEVLLTELLDAQVTLADAERQIVDLDAQLALAHIELDAAVGASASSLGGAPSSTNPSPSPSSTNPSPSPSSTNPSPSPSSTNPSP